MGVGETIDGTKIHYLPLYAVLFKALTGLYAGLFIICHADDSRVEGP